MSQYYVKQAQDMTMALHTDRLSPLRLSFIYTSKLIIIFTIQLKEIDTSLC
jgi:hypothetical protein